MNLVWNPGFPGLFAVCISSGSVLTMELTDSQVKTLAALPASIKASASKYLSTVHVIKNYRWVGR